MNNEEIENNLFKKLKELTSLPKSFTEIMSGLYNEIIHLFEKNGTCNTRMLSNFFQILVHLNLHDVYSEKKYENHCMNSIQSQCDLFFEFMYFRFGNLKDLTKIIKDSLENIIKINLKNDKIENTSIVECETCLMLLKKRFFKNSKSNGG